MKKLISLVLIVTSLLWVGCGSESSSAPTLKESYKEGDKIELKSVAGAKLTLLRKNGAFVIEDDESKIILIDIFGTFCAPCQEEAPSLMDFQLQNSDNVMLIGLNFFEEVSDEYVVKILQRSTMRIISLPTRRKIKNWLRRSFKILSTKRHCKCLSK